MLLDEVKPDVYMLGSGMLNIVYWLKRVKGGCQSYMIVDGSTVPFFFLILFGLLHHGRRGEIYDGSCQTSQTFIEYDGSLSRLCCELLSYYHALEESKCRAGVVFMWSRELRSALLIAEVILMCIHSNGRVVSRKVVVVGACRRSLANGYCRAQARRYLRALVECSCRSLPTDCSELSTAAETCAGTSIVNYGKLSFVGQYANEDHQLSAFGCS
ncbi:hypothetical protein Tco_0214885 [Tanacetum coccineum]